ncbi:FAD-binding protein [Eggerthella sinensis]|uniref:FAD-dependent oxidoreductase n=1 Tax=Eggerthella sinensis TaxID=242230 RepID=UPI00248EC9C3|nr:FAD-binding protein [Eggerthella sinensis]
MKNIDRRGFLTGAMATGALAATGALFGCAPSDGEGKAAADASSPAPERAGSASATWDARPASVASDASAGKDYDVVIVGAGNSGMIAALRAAELGGKVAVLEQSGAPTSWAGDIDACGSALMEEAGIEVDKEFVIHDLVRYASGKCDENLIRLWAYNSGAFVDWYQETLQKKGADVMLDVVKKKFYPDDFYFTNVYHTAYQPPLKETANPMGSEVAMPILVELFEAAGGELLFDTKVVELVQDGEGGRVTGVIAETDGGYVAYGASKGVMLCCGGFLGNKDMMDEWGVVSHKYCSNHIGGDGRNGDGIKLATWAGAARDASSTGSMLIFDRGCITTADDDGGLGAQGGTSPNFWWPGSQPFLRVNALGQRFCNEDNTYDFAFNLAVQQPGHYWWQVFDASCWEDIVSFGTTICSRLVAEEGAKNCLLLGQFYPCRSAEEYEEVYLGPNVENGNVIKCDSLDELADAMGLDADAKKNFLASVARYNEVAASGTDTDYHKAPWRLSAVDEAPYYAVKLAGWALATLSGVHVNDKMQAVTPAGKPIEGLYVGGLDVGGFFNGNYPQLYGGLCMGRCVTLSWLAAHAMMGKEYPTPVESAQLAF